MKVRVYAVLPTTEPNTMEAVSGVVKVDGPEDVASYVAAVARLWPEWEEISIERITGD